MGAPATRPLIFSPKSFRVGKSIKVRGEKADLNLATRETLIGYRGDMDNFQRMYGWLALAKNSLKGCEMKIFEIIRFEYYVHTKTR